MRIFAEEQVKARPEVEAQVRAKFKERTGRDAPEPLSNALTERINYQLRRLSERRMWERVGREVAASEAKTGEVVLPAGGEFSAQPGRFKIVADASKIRLREGPLPLIDAIRASGAATPVPALEADVVALARTLRLAGTVRNVFRVGGRILIVAAIANDLYHVIIAEDKTEAVLQSAGGWAGAEAAALAFSAMWVPADIAGPWAWAIHGVGMLVSGAVGYWIGSGATRHVYRLIIHGRGDIPVQ
jgi:hypothetical protein